MDTEAKLTLDCSLPSPMTVSSCPVISWLKMRVCWSWCSLGSLDSSPSPGSPPLPPGDSIPQRATSSQSVNNIHKKLILWWWWLFRKNYSQLGNLEAKHPLWVYENYINFMCYKYFPDALTSFDVLGLVPAAFSCSIIAIIFCLSFLKQNFNIYFSWKLSTVK